MPRSKTIALARQADAVARFRDGETFEQISEGVGLANRGNAHRIVTKAFREQIVEDVDSYRRAELERIDFVESELLAIIESTDSPNVKIRALREVLAASKQRSKVLGLHDHTQAPAPEARTLFDYSIGQLREGNTCRISGAGECGFEPADHSSQCVMEKLGFEPNFDSDRIPRSQHASRQLG